MRRTSRKKNSTKIFIAATIVAALIFSASHYLISKRSDGNVVAKINGDKIYKSDIEKKLRSVFEGQNQGINLPEVENLPKEVIEILAKEIYLDKELTKTAAKSKAGKSEETLGRITEAKDKILRQAYVDSLIKSEITDQKINEKYVELTNELAGKKEYLVSHIVVKTKEDAEKIAQSLQKSTKFSEAAKKYSIDQESAGKGGELGYILEDNIIKEISEAVTKLKKNEISAPIQTKFGWHLVKFSDVRDAKALPFESVKENIRDQLIQDKLNEINSEIIKDAKIEILIQLKEEAPAPAQAEPTTTEQPATTPEVELTPQNSENTTSPTEQKTESAQEETKSEEKPAAKSPEKSQEKLDAKSKNKKSKHKKHN